MTFETPIERVPARPIRLAFVVAGLVAATGILVWQPWSSGSATPATRVAAGATNVAEAPSATQIASPTLYAAPRALDLLREAAHLRLPTADRFRPRWSAVGVAQLPDPEIRITQLPMVPTSGHVEGGSATQVCEIARLGSAMVALLPADQLLLIGIAAPAGALPGPVEITQIGAPPLAAFEAQLPATPGPDRAVASARLFVRADLLPWPEGVYSFLTESNDGSPRWLYACLVSPASVDGV